MNDVHALVNSMTSGVAIIFAAIVLIRQIGKDKKENTKLRICFGDVSRIGIERKKKRLRLNVEVYNHNLYPECVKQINVILKDGEVLENQTDEMRKPIDAKGRTTYEFYVDNYNQKIKKVILNNENGRKSEVEKYEIEFINNERLNNIIEDDSAAATYDFIGH